MMEVGRRMRDEHDPLLVCIGTVIAGNPQLSCRRMPSCRNPHRIVLDRDLRTRVDVCGESQASKVPPARTGLLLGTGRYFTITSE